MQGVHVVNVQDNMNKVEQANAQGYYSAAQLGINIHRLQRLVVAHNVATLRYGKRLWFFKRSEVERAILKDNSDRNSSTSMESEPDTIVPTSWLNATEAAAKHGVHFCTFSKWRKSGHIEGIRGKREDGRKEWYYNPLSLDSYCMDLAKRKAKIQQDLAGMSTAPVGMSGTTTSPATACISSSPMPSDRMDVLSDRISVLSDTVHVLSDRIDSLAAGMNTVMKGLLSTIDRIEALESVKITTTEPLLIKAAKFTQNAKPNVDWRARRKETHKRLSEILQKAAGAQLNFNYYGRMVNICMQRLAGRSLEDLTDQEIQQQVLHLEAWCNSTTPLHHPGFELMRPRPEDYLQTAGSMTTSS